MYKTVFVVAAVFVFVIQGALSDVKVRVFYLFTWLFKLSASFVNNKRCRREPKAMSEEHNINMALRGPYFESVLYTEDYFSFN